MTFGADNHEIVFDWETADGGARCSCTFPQASPHSCDSVSLGRRPGALYQVPAMCASFCVICHLPLRDRSSQAVQSYTGINSQFEFRVARQPVSDSLPNEQTSEYTFQAHFGHVIHNPRVFSLEVCHLYPLAPPPPLHRPILIRQSSAI